MGLVSFGHFRPGGSLCVPSARYTLVLDGRMCQHGTRPKMGESPESSKNAQSAFAEQRKVPRFTFIAAVELTEPLSGVRISGRISEISRKGCFVDILNTLPVDTFVQVRIVRDQGTFTTPGKIVYAQEPMGMGIAFIDPPTDQQETLDKWVAELTDPL
jgi:hypothetical protein